MCLNKPINNPCLKGEFDWDAEDQGIILGSFYYGYTVMQPFGGYLAERFGGKWIMAFSLLSSSALNLLTPLSAKTAKWLLITTRVAQESLKSP